MAPVEGHLLKEMHKTILKVTTSIDSMTFNVAISTLMVYSSLLHSLCDRESNLSQDQKLLDGRGLPIQALETLALLLAPLAPHLAEECWQMLGHSNTLAYTSWPEHDPNVLIEDTFQVKVNVNGKHRETISVSISEEEKAVTALALEKVKDKPSMTGKTVKKIVYVHGKIVNFIV
jgi:leucyl-tRNA synthetase